VVLIVEPDQAIGALLTDVLESEGYIPAFVSDAGGALAFLASLRPHLILLGLTLAGLSGERLLMLLRALPSTSDIPVVIMTARSAVSPSVEAKAAAVVMKPFVLDELLLVIGHALAPRFARQRGV
jgi:DNA-binding response OmpR family regulator